jgi:hypothetical protein
MAARPPRTAGVTRPLWGLRSLALAVCLSVSSRAQLSSPSPSFTSTATMTATPTPSYLPLYCASCPLYKLSVVNDYLYWSVPVDAPYSWLGVAMWGAGGSSTWPGFSRTVGVVDPVIHGTRGAFIMGALRVVKGETLRIIVGSAGGSSADYHGCGSTYVIDSQNSAKGGGRSAIQRRLQELPESAFKDIAVAGGGGGIATQYWVTYTPREDQCVSDGGSASTASGPAAAAGASTANFSSCVNGLSGCGVGPGAGGFCGGGSTVGPDKYGGDTFVCGGGGSSNPSNLECAYGADSQKGNLANLHLPDVGTLGSLGSDGGVWIWILPPSWEPCVKPQFPTPSATSSASATMSPSPSATQSSTSTFTPTASSTSTPSPTPSGTPTASRTSTPTTSPTPTSTSSSANSVFQSPTPTPSTSPSSSPWPALDVRLGLGNANLTALAEREALGFFEGALLDCMGPAALAARVLSVCAATTPPGCTYTAASRRLQVADDDAGPRVLSNVLGYVLVTAEVLFLSPSSLSTAAASVESAPSAFSARLSSALVNTGAAMFGSVSLSTLGVLVQSRGGGVSPPTQEPSAGLLFSTVQVAGWVFVVVAASTLVVLVTAVAITRWRMKGRVAPSSSEGATANYSPTTTASTTATTAFVSSQPVGGWVVSNDVPPQRRGGPVQPQTLVWNTPGSGQPFRQGALTRGPPSSSSPLM